MSSNEQKLLLLISLVSFSLSVGLFLASPLSAAPQTQNKTTATQSKSVASAKSKTASVKRPQVLDFSAVWCGPCKKFAPVFDKVAQNYKGRVDFVHYDVETGPGKPLADKYKINTVPTIMFFDAKGKMVFKYGELMKEEDLVKHTEDLLK